MAAIVPSQARDRIAINASQTSSYDATRYFRTMTVDDQSSGFLDTDTSLDRGGALTVTNLYVSALDATPADPSGNQVDHVMTVPTGSGNFTIARIALADDAAGSVDATTDTLGPAIDGQSWLKTSDFTVTPTVSLLYADAS